MEVEPVFAVVTIATSSSRYPAPETASLGLRSRSARFLPGDIVQVLESDVDLPFVQFSNRGDKFALLYTHEFEVLK